MLGFGFWVLGFGLRVCGCRAAGFGCRVYRGCPDTTLRRLFLGGYGKTRGTRSAPKGFERPYEKRPSLGRAVQESLQT